MLATWTFTAVLIKFQQLKLDVLLYSTLFVDDYFIHMGEKVLDDLATA